ncbi:MAG: exodeoxyribonuclease VII large subunit [Acidobacteria bacterium]|nr:exodeoxyribonuclease VII large subunit [Acidobacteriota bacterium]
MSNPGLFDDEPAAGSRTRPLTVTELNERADAVLRERVGPAWIAGEIARFTAHGSGHWYFNLIDGKGSVGCAMFRGRNSSLRFRPTEGMSVLVMAVPGVYAAQGKFQLIVEHMEPAGAGAAALALEQRKQRLAAEGLFDAGRKKPLPMLARRIGVATSVDGAALRDVLRVLRRRFAGVAVLVAPCCVQGATSPGEIVEALGALDRRGLDVILLVRGGGAREDLAAFDDERVVRAVAACRTPVVAGIGHEIDTTLADLAADLRAPTPSAAAEVVVRERHELLRRVDGLRRHLVQCARHYLGRARGRLQVALGSRAFAMDGRLARLRVHSAELERRLERAHRERLRRRRERLDALRARLAPEAHLARVRERQQRLARLVDRLAPAVRRGLAAHRGRLADLAGRARGLSPLDVLARGYAVVHAGNRAGPIVRDAAALAAGETIFIRLARGAATAAVTRTQSADDDHGSR